MHPGMSSLAATDRTVTLGACLFAVTIGFVALVVVAGEPEQRRSWFALRVLLAAVILPGMAFVAVQGGRLGLVSPRAEPVAAVLLLGLGVPALLMYAPALLYRRPPRDGGSDGGGDGGGPEHPPTPPPMRPRGGIPLPDADPARIRLRDHVRPGWAPADSHRPQRRPVRLQQAAARRDHPEPAGEGRGLLWGQIGDAIGARLRHRPRQVRPAARDARDPRGRPEADRRAQFGGAGHGLGGGELAERLGTARVAGSRDWARERVLVGDGHATNHLGIADNPPLRIARSVSAERTVPG
jgi:hypothetical protein